MGSFQGPVRLEPDSQSGPNGQGPAEALDYLRLKANVTKFFLRVVQEEECTAVGAWHRTNWEYNLGFGSTDRPPLRLAFDLAYGVVMGQVAIGAGHLSGLRCYPSHADDDEGAFSFRIFVHDSFNANRLQVTLAWILKSQRSVFLRDMQAVADAFDVDIGELLTKETDGMPEPFEAMLTGGHPNSLGRTIEVVDIVLADPLRFDELYLCYRSEDEVVRLRVSNAMRRIEAERHDLLVPYIDRYIEEIGELDQPSAQWTLAKLFEALQDDMTSSQREAALGIMKRNLAGHDDWIVLNNSMETLANWSKDDPALQNWLRPHLARLSKDSRKSVAKRAGKLAAIL